MAFISRSTSTALSSCRSVGYSLSNQASGQQSCANLNPCLPQLIKSYLFLIERILRKGVATGLVQWALGALMNTAKRTQGPVCEKSISGYICALILWHNGSPLLYLSRLTITSVIRGLLAVSHATTFYHLYVRMNRILMAIKYRLRHLFSYRFNQIWFLVA